MLEIKKSQQSYKSLETITYNMDNLSNKPVSLLNLIPESTPVTPDISQPIIPTPQTFAQAFSAARRAGVKVFDYKGKKYGTQLKGETETAGKGVVAVAKTKKENVRGSNKPVDDNTPVATVNLPGVEVVAKKYSMANIGGREYWFPNEERKNAFVDRVNRAINDSLTNKKYGYNPKKNWYRTKIG